MTAEVAVMNKHAVALAADSAVTISDGSDKQAKIYNTVNKLFMLSRSQPVAVMVYGVSELMDIPIEIVIKSYRGQLGDASFEAVTDYAQDFASYIEDAGLLFPTARQSAWVTENVAMHFLTFRLEIDEAVKDLIDQTQQVGDVEIAEIRSRVFRDHWNPLATAPFLSGFEDSDIERFRALHVDAVDEAMGFVFQAHPLSDQDKTMLHSYAEAVFFKYPVSRQSMGIVIAGYGTDDYFPQLAELQFDGVVAGRLRVISRHATGVTFDTPATIIPFAQSEVVGSFINGVSPIIRAAMGSHVDDTFQRYANFIVDKIPDLSNDERDALLGDLLEIAKIQTQNFNERIKEAVTGYSDPLIEVVQFLPKEELAEMAEALVFLTKLKRRLSRDAETVGGPIDVAVVSKGDGFIWIKRKHYFNPQLNPAYLGAFYRNLGGIGGDDV